MNQFFDFSSQQTAGKALQRIGQMMLRAGQPVVTTEFSPKIKRSSGVGYREAMLTLASGQIVTLRVTQTGDIFQVLLNGSIRPIKNATDMPKAVAEIAKMAEANQVAFQKKQARVKVELPKGIKTAAPRMEVALQERVAQLDTQIAERQSQVDALKEELGEPVLDAASPSGVIAWHDGKSYTRDQFEMVPADEHGEMPPTLCLKSGAIPVLDDTAGGAPDIAAALALAESVLSGTVLDSADTSAAVATLQVALEIVETNYVINMSEGDLEQAELERSSAESFRAAIALLDDSEQPPLPVAKAPEPSTAADPAVAAAAALQYASDGQPDKSQNLP